MDYYIDNCLEPDFTENDMIYDDIDGLEEMLLDVRIFTPFYLPNSGEAGFRFEIRRQSEWQTSVT